MPASLLHLSPRKSAAQKKRKEIGARRVQCFDRRVRPAQSKHHLIETGSTPRAIALCISRPFRYISPPFRCISRAATRARTRKMGDSRRANRGGKKCEKARRARASRKQQQQQQRRSADESLPLSRWGIGGRAASDAVLSEILLERRRRGEAPRGVGRSGPRITDAPSDTPPPRPAKKQGEARPREGRWRRTA